MHIPLLFLLFLIADLSGLAMLSTRIHFLPTLAYVVLGLVFGSALLRRAFSPARGERNGESPEVSGRSGQRPPGDSLVLGLAGFLLCQPGPLSDILAVLLLGPIRPWARRQMLRVVNQSVAHPTPSESRGPSADPRSSPQTVDAKSVRTIRS